MKTLEQYTPQEINDEAARLTALHGPEGGLREYFSWLGRLRAECFERLAEAMNLAADDALTDWASQMSAVHGPKVKVHRTVLSWIAALAVVRYGEAPDHWPPSFTADDVLRAKRWLYQGNVPDGITYLTVEG